MEGGQLWVWGGGGGRNPVMEGQIQIVHKIVTSAETTDNPVTF